MSLQVWLPLVGDNHNQGLLSLTPTNIGTVSYANSGKLGKCLSAGTGSQVTNGISYNSNLLDILQGDYSCAIWVRPLGSHVHYNGTFISSGDWNNNCWSFGVSQDNSQVDVLCSKCNTYINCAVPVNEWTHLVCTKQDDVIKLYKNGEYVGQRSPGSTLSSDASNFTVGRETYANGYFSFNGNINDIRIYDHALSMKEIKFLSQGLVAHYTLGDRYVTDNLIINGYGELGSENWSNAYISTTEIPSSLDPNVKESFHSGNYTIGFSPINPKHSYTISAYLKSTGSTTTSYPSILPYDADKKFIAAFNCLDGFNSTYKTTLAQPLHTGDTVIHATDLSAWTTGDNYYYHVAIFGYTDASGNIYPDMGYTQDSPTFGTKTNKTNINKTNNTITLLSAYTGADRPAGTLICQATEGDTYWYPFGAISTSTVTDWTLKTCTFTPNSLYRLRWARYLRYQAYSGGLYHAGIKLVDNTDTDKTVYDSSGYNHHGQFWRYNTQGTAVSTATTPRYSAATFINSEDTVTSTASGTVMIYAPCSLTTPSYLTASFWCKPVGGYGGTTDQGQFCLTLNDVGIGAGTDYNTAPMHHRDSCIDLNTSGNTHKTVSITFTANEWHHYAVVYDGRYGRVYKDGVPGGTVDMGSSVSLASMSAIVLGYSHAGGVIRSNKSYFSDFRLYATALSADDIRELYQTSASVDKLGNIYAYEFNEV